MKLKGLIDFLEDRLINKLSEMDNEIERVEIFNYPEIDMKTLSWIGGSILPKLESAKDMWIQKEEKKDENGPISPEELQTPEIEEDKNNNNKMEVEKEEKKKLEKRKKWYLNQKKLSKRIMKIKIYSKIILLMI